MTDTWHCSRYGQERHSETKNGRKKISKVTHIFLKSQTEVQMTGQFRYGSQPPTSKVKYVSNHLGELFISGTVRWQKSHWNEFALLQCFFMILLKFLSTQEDTKNNKRKQYESSQCARFILYSQVLCNSF